MDFLKIQKIDLYSYEIPLVYPVAIQNHKIDKRMGYILKLTTESKSFAYGDIAPLQGLHTETWGEIPDLITKISEPLKQYPLSADLPLNEPEFMERNIPPTVRFGVESAILGLTDMNRNRSHQKHFFSDLVADIRINSLIDPTDGLAEEAVSKARANGFTCIKIKMGRQPLETDIKMIKRICDKAGDSISLRLDSNRLWSLADAIKFCTAIPLRTIEYLEEPLREPNALEQLYKAIPVPLAVDESLTENDPKSVLEQNWISVAVVKPAVSGGIFNTFKLMRYAEQLNKKVVISDTYHSGVGVSMLTRIAAIRRKQMTAAGLDTYSRLEADVLQKRISIQSGIVKLADAQKKSRQLNFNRLTHHELY